MSLTDSTLTFSNSLLKPEDLTDRKCNALCELFAGSKGVQNGVVIHSDLLLEHMKYITSEQKSMIKRILGEMNHEKGRKTGR